MRAIILLLMWGLAGIATAADLELEPIQIAPGVYAVIGDLGGQSAANHGLNSNLGFIVGRDGVLIINSGPSARAARALHAAIRKRTSQPVRWVVNVNAQSHYWLGNGYFKKLGAVIVAQQEAGRLMQEQGPGQLEGIQRLLQGGADATRLVYPDELFSDQKEIRLGSTTVHLLHFGNAHTPGDLVVWLPQERIAFTGDIVFTERLLAVLPIGSSAGWIKAFDRLAALEPVTLVPGHGRPATLDQARRDTRGYLSFLRDQAQQVFDAGGSLQDAVDKVDQSRFSHLENYELLSRRNMNQVFQEVERESF